MTDGDRLEILDEAGLPFGGGACGEVAIAIRDVLFGGSAELLAVVNKALWKRGTFVGHVGVDPGDGAIWDSRGCYFGDDAIESFRAWGMVDPDDPDYWGDGGAGWGETGEETEDLETLYVKMTSLQVRAALPACLAVDPNAPLIEARRRVLGRSHRSGFIGGAD